MEFARVDIQRFSVFSLDSLEASESLCIIINFYYACIRLYCRNNVIICQLSTSSHSWRQEGMWGALVFQRDFPPAFSSLYTQGKVIKLISGTKSFLQLETNSLGCETTKATVSSCEDQIKTTGNLSTPFAPRVFSYFLGRNVSQQSLFLCLLCSRAADMHLGITWKTLHFLVPLSLLPQGYWNPVSFPDIQIHVIEKVASAIAEAYQQHPK